MKRIKLTFAIVITFIQFTLAQSYVEIGSGTVSTSYPPYTVWNYGWFSMIYPNSALGSEPKTITSIAFNCNNGPKTINNQKIYMKNTTDNVFGNANYENPTGNGYTLVFDGNINYNGWTIITLSTPFVYDGTGNLIIHYENRAGSSSYANFNATTSAINNNKGAGNDVTFPTGSGYLNPFPSALPNVRIYYTSSAPATPDNPFPISNATKVLIDETLTFSLGANTTLYDLYLGTDSAAIVNLNSSYKVVADASVTVAGTYSYANHVIFTQNTKYFWKVVAKNATQSTPSPLWKFTTQRVIENFPFEYGFEDSTVFYPGWYGMHTDWSYLNSPVNWNQGGSLNARSGVGCAYNNCTVNGSYPLMTPRINLHANHRISFWWKNTTPNVKVGTYDTTYFEITTNGGNTWTVLDFLSPATPSVAYEQAVIDLSAYAGNNVYLRWRQNILDWTSAKAIMLDDIVIEEIPDYPVIQLSTEDISFQEICVGGYTSYKVSIRNNGTQNLDIANITSSNTSFYCNYSGIILPSQTDTVTIVFQPSQAGILNAVLTINVNGTFAGTNTIAVDGYGVNPVNVIAEAFDASTSLPSHWNKIKSPTDNFTDVTIVYAPSDAYSGTNCAKILALNDTISPLMLITPGVTGFTDHEFSFWAFKYGSYDLDLLVGLMDDPYDASSFTLVQTIPLTENYVKYTVTFDPANTKPYIAIKHGGNKKLTSARIDDVYWQPSAPTIPYCASVVAPSDGAINVIPLPTLVWSNGGGNPTGYKVYHGTTNPPTTLIADINTTSYTFTSPLALNTVYYWKVVPYNGLGEAIGCPVWNYITMSDQTIVTFPWLEDFNAVEQTAGSTVPLGWVNEITSPNPLPVYWDLMIPANPIHAHSPPKCMNVGPNYYEKDCWLITPAVLLNGGTTYRLSFWYKNAIGLGGEFEKMEVKWGTAQNAASMTLGQLFNDDYIYEGTNYIEANCEFTPSTNGLYYFGFHAYSDANQFILFLDDVSIDIVTNIKEQAKNEIIKVFPNPTKTTIHIDFNGIKEKKIAITDLKGTIFLEQIASEKIEKIDLSALPSGLYILKIYTEDEVRNFKIVKQ